ncbi:Clavaminate synthase-like protein [Gonapodya prolifera JEL478]|uniref:Clavaminate synthase-like protein n=1 Tax=Gonapodya prolifera (strain JEL478) TaxID=1344416 RepID=A0A139A622_GONPJ|nr:Clavaminate synthase-like protein [Gonapodya prolifera JEL478]|eukprot:KXS12109.1 Clavaminate synthase-like protein [Gonapodya prolifera JEL478]
MLDFLSTIGPELGAGDLSSPYRIPIVDLSLPDAPSRLVTACRTWGSFVAINGGVPTSYQSDLLSLARAFFSLDNATKRTLDVGQSGVAWRGYVPPGVESMDGKMELKEGLYVGPEHGPEHPRVKASTPFYGPNQFPDTTLPGLRPAALNYIEAVTDLGGRFMDLLSIGLGLPTQTLREAFKHDDPVTLLGLFSYPPARKVTKTGTGEHTDYGLWTIISADASGMAYWNEEVGVWGEVPHIPGSIICNVGDLLDRATHGLLPSPPHRVLNLSPHTRIAIPLFFDPSWSTEVTPLPLPPSLLGEAADPKRRAAAEKRWAGTSVGEMKGKYAAFLTRNG